MADATASIIDAEVRRIVDDAYDAATKILKKKVLSWKDLPKGCLNTKLLTVNE